MECGKSSKHLGIFHDGLGIFHTLSLKLFPVDAAHGCCLVKSEVVNHTPQLFLMRFVQSLWEKEFLV